MHTMGTETTTYIHIYIPPLTIDPYPHPIPSHGQVGNVEAHIEERDIYNAFFPSGPVMGIHLARAARCAFVEMGTREAAEAAARQLYGALVVKVSREIYNDT